MPLTMNSQRERSVVIALLVGVSLFVGAARCTPSSPSASGRDDGTPEEQATRAAAPEEKSTAKREPDASSADDASDTQTESPDGSDAGDVSERNGVDAGELVERAMDPGVRLPKRAREVLSEIDLDAKPEELTKKSHYWVSNENHHHVYRRELDDHGGIFIGVGTDQVYMMAAWARSPIIIPMDFDEQIRNLHDIYGVVFEHVDNPDDFIAQWSDEGAGEIRKWLKDAYDDRRFAQLKKTLSKANDHVYYRLRTTAEAYEKAEIPCFITDEAQYEFIRQLWQNDRVYPVRGDLTGDKTMLDIAEGLRSLGLEVGLLYVSNAEQYFEFVPAYRRNIVALPFAEESFVLRTRPMEALGVPEGGDYHYNLQKGRNFEKWMHYNHVTKVKHLLGWYKSDSQKIDGLSFIKKEAPRSDDAPDLADVGSYDVKLQP